MRCAWAAIFALMFAGAAAAQEATRIRVVDEPTRLGVAFAMLTLETDGKQAVSAVTDSLGFAHITLPERRIYGVRVTALGYAEETREIDFARADLEQIPAFVMKPQVFLLTPVEVEARREGYRRSSGAASTMRTISGERMVRMRLAGLYLEDALRELPGIRVSYQRGRLCVESVRRGISMRGPTTGCRMITVVVNDIPYYDAEEWLRGATLDNFESIEFLSPMDAGFRYGLEASQTGVLVLWTRGRGPHALPNVWIGRK